MAHLNSNTAPSVGFRVFIFCILLNNLNGQNLNGTNDTSNLVEEIQHAICKIATDEVQASANASVIRQLNGVCSTNEMNDRFDQLETKLLNEINVIKRALEMEGYILPKNMKSKTLETPMETPLADDYLDYSNMETEQKYLDLKNGTNESRERMENNEINVNEANIMVPQFVLKKYIAEKNDNVSDVSEFEAIKNNATIQITEMGLTFLYFWRIPNIQEILSLWETHVESPSIYLTGNLLKIKLYPHHLGTNYATLELQTNKNVAIKHCFAILNQNNIGNDMTSQILGTDANIYRISYQKLSSEGFIKKNGLIIKLMIAL